MGYKKVEKLLGLREIAKMPVAKFETAEA